MKVIVNYREGHKLPHLIEEPQDADPGTLSIPGPPAYGNTELIDAIAVQNQGDHWLVITQADGTKHHINRDWTVSVSAIPDVVWAAGLKAAAE